ncbi:hypothetical protein N7E02_08885 [Aliirhizobium terrae]|uniref:hypothetical protein n=1 Tax=Terrirhizobium terrae TaxID=2926709 RepID=UPI002574D249|nr:hypothetical protein [Rhizobium sp. CC-CFT758]WJH40702.1 hypothetical protein N7E02_08885 [Rhizobium sp. CC-CFT758]
MTLLYPVHERKGREVLDNFDHWAADRLGRKQDAEFLYNFLIGELDKRRSQGRVPSYVLNVDADWGGGSRSFLTALLKT